MDLFITTAESIAILLAIGFLGFYALSRNVVPTDCLKFLSPLATEIALPALVFTRVVAQFDPYTYSMWWQLPLWWCGSVVLFFVLSVVGARIAHKETRTEFFVSLLYNNAIFFPIAIIVGMFGDESPHLVNLFFYTILFSIFLFNTPQIFFRKNFSFKKMQRLWNPVVIAVLCGVLVRLFRVDPYVPTFVMRSLRMVGDMTVPILMIIFGGNLYLDFKRRGTVYGVEVLKFVIIKNFLFPFVTLLFIILLKLPYAIALLVALGSAVPPVTLLPVLTEREGGNQGVVNQFMLASFLVSMVSIPLVIVVFSKIYVQ